MRFYDNRFIEEDVLSMNREVVKEVSQGTKYHKLDMCTHRLRFWVRALWQIQGTFVSYNLFKYKINIDTLGGFKHNIQKPSSFHYKTLSLFTI